MPLIEPEHGFVIVVEHTDVVCVLHAIEDKANARHDGDIGYVDGQ